MSRIRILIVDDHEVIRAGLALVLRQEHLLVALQRGTVEEPANKCDPQAVDEPGTE